MTQKLLASLKSFPNVEVFFEHGLNHCDLKNGTLYFDDKVNECIKQIQTDLLIGADGAHSKVRTHIDRLTLMDFSQQYIDHGYCELTINSIHNRNGPSYAMEPNYLHIWPRKTFMLIALPNRDFSFTCTLFMPFSHFDEIRDHRDLITFFQSEFPDALQLIGENTLVKQYFSNPKGPLMTITCSPFHYEDKAVLIGDAAHCMVPFFGQGMNAGFEDVRILDEILSSKGIDSFFTPNQIRSALNEYSRSRRDDVRTICRLALNNYIEMRSSVVSYRFLLKKKIDSFLHYLFPNHFIPLYSMVSFSNIPYHEIVKKNQLQNVWLTRLGILCCFCFGVILWQIFPY